MICPAPIMSALAMCSSPSGPEPMTTTVSPELKPSIAYELNSLSLSRLAVHAMSSASTATRGRQPVGTL